MAGEMVLWLREKVSNDFLLPYKDYIKIDILVAALPEVPSSVPSPPTVANIVCKSRPRRSSGLLSLVITASLHTYKTFTHMKEKQRYLSDCQI